MTGDSPKHSVSVAGVIVDDAQRVLLVRRRDNGDWTIPGGVLELDEDVYAGLRREVYEEAGLWVEPLRLSGVYKNMTLGVVALTFLCRAVDGTPRISDETSDWAWIASAQVGERMKEVFAIRVLDALASPVSIPIRTHDGHRLLSPAPASREPG